MGEGSYSGGRLFGQFVAKVGLLPILTVVVVGAVALVMSKNASTQREVERAATERRLEAENAAAAEKAKGVACVEKMPELIGKAQAAIRAGEPQAASDLVKSCLAYADGPEVQGVLADSRKFAASLKAKAEAEQLIKDKKAAAELKAKKKRSGVQLGMTAQDVLDSNWGRPEKVNRTIGSFGTHEQWVYGDSYLYFENGILKTIQN